MSQQEGDVETALPPREDWWAMFPLRGLVVSDDDLGITRPLWDDATLMSMARLPDIVRMLKLNDRMAPGHDHEKDVLFLLGSSPAIRVHKLRDPEDIPDSYIAIRRRVDRDSQGRISVSRSAATRAATLEAALAIGLMEEGKFGFRTVGLPRHGKAPFVPTAALDLGQGGFLVQFGGPNSLWKLRTEPSIYARRELATALLASKHPTLVEVLTSQPTSQDAPIDANLRRAACRLTAACFSPSAENQVSGMVTALEMLMSVDGDFRMLERRLCILLADVPVATDVIRWLLTARHEHVHQGKEVRPDIPYDAISRVLEAFERIARSRGTLPSQDQLCAYLDARAAAIRLADRVPLMGEFSTNAPPPWGLSSDTEGGRN